MRKPLKFNKNHGLRHQKKRENLIKNVSFFTSKKRYPKNPENNDLGGFQGSIWEGFGELLGAFWALLGASGASWALFGRLLDALGRFFGTSWAS